MTAERVSDSDRLDFLPELVGARHMLRFEAAVYAWMDRLAPGEYRGGFWNFYRVPGAGYLAPAVSDTDTFHDGKAFHVVQDMNGYRGEMSADAAGLTATLFALNGLANATADERHIAAYYALRDFACDHPEAGEILAAID